MTARSHLATILLLSLSTIAGCVDSRPDGDGVDDGLDDNVDLPPGATEPQTLDGKDAGDVGDYAAIAVTPTGDVHISYVDRVSGKLKYVRSTGGVFGQPQTIDAAGSSIVQNTAVAIDGRGDVHIVYHDASAVDLLHVRSSGGVFGAPVILDGTGHQSGTGLKLATDKSGELHVIYFDYEAVNFKYASTTAGTFGAGTPVPEVIGGSSPAIAVDSAGALQVSAWDEISGLSYTKRTGSAFTAPKIVDMGGVGELSAIAIGPSDKVHIAYSDQTNLKLKYVSGTGATFDAPVVADGEGQGGIHPSLSVDGGGNAHIVHHDFSAEKARYLRIDPSGTISNQKIVDAAVATGTISAVATDAGGNAHIVYYAVLGADRGALKYLAIEAPPRVN